MIPTVVEHPYFWDPNHPADVSRLSRGNVPLVPQTFCQVYVELHINQVGTSRMSRDSPPKHPRDTSKAYRPPHSFMRVLCVSFSLFFSPMLGRDMSAPQLIKDESPVNLASAHWILPRFFSHKSFGNLRKKTTLIFRP